MLNSATKRPLLQNHSTKAHQLLILKTHESWRSWKLTSMVFYVFLISDFQKWLPMICKSILQNASSSRFSHAWASQDHERRYTGRISWLSHFWTSKPPRHHQNVHFVELFCINTLPSYFCREWALGSLTAHQLQKKRESNFMEFSFLTFKIPKVSSKRSFSETNCQFVQFASVKDKFDLQTAKRTAVLVCSVSWFRTCCCALQYMACFADERRQRVFCFAFAQTQNRLCPHIKWAATCRIEQHVPENHVLAFWVPMY